MPGQCLVSMFILSLPVTTMLRHWSIRHWSSQGQVNGDIGQYWQQVNTTGNIVGHHGYGCSTTMVGVIGRNNATIATYWPAINTVG